jgi:putative endonuclease
MAKSHISMYYTYVLKSLKDLLLYIGSTDNLKRRFKEHSNGEVQSTKYRRPLKLIFYEAFSNREDAICREKYFKTTKGKTTLKIMLRESLK